MATRNVKPAPRGKPSGLPFASRFTDVAHNAGLRSPVIYGPVDHKDYVLEAVGCGVAFLDYDNDGWLDIFLLSGSRMDGASDATNRLYRNNRDGTFTDVTEKAGLRHQGWASAVTVGDYNNDGFEDLFVTYWGENVLYRNNGDGTFTDVTEKAGLLHGKSRWSSGCTFVDYDRNGLSGPVRRQLPGVRSENSAAAGPEPQLQLEGDRRALRTTRTAARLRIALSQ